MAHRAHAIIILPAVILIPIAKLVAFIIGALALPSAGLGVVWKKLFNTSGKKIVGVIICVLLIIALVTVVILKLTNPSRPLF